MDEQGVGDEDALEEVAGLEGISMIIITPSASELRRGRRRGRMMLMMPVMPVMRACRSAAP